MTPTGSGAKGHRLQCGDDSLRVSAPLKRSAPPASNIFRRLTAAAPHHGVSHAWNAFEPILKRHCLLRVLDEPGWRLASEPVRRGIAPGPRFPRTVSVGNPREGLQAEHEDQEMADAGTRLLTHCIIGWTALSVADAGRDRGPDHARGMAPGDGPWVAGRRGADRPGGDYEFSGTRVTIRSVSRPQQ